MLYLLLFVVLATIVEAHTWIDCFDTDRAKIYDQSASYIFGGAGGNGFCEGYGAGYPGRGDTNIGTEYTFKMLENEVKAGTAVCETVDAGTYSNTAWRKRLSVAAGQPVYFAYLPNGHIVKDKKAIGTQHGVYWTGQVGTSLTSTLDMKAENLVDGHTMDFDDGNCGETYDYNGKPGGRAGDGKPCIGSFTIPTGTAPGIYSMVWYWTFWLDDASKYADQSLAKGYFGAAYSTCFEVEVTSSGSTTTSTPTTTSTTTTTASLSTLSTAPIIVNATAEATTAAPSTTTATKTASKAGATATFSGLDSSGGSLASVHAQGSSSGDVVADYAGITFGSSTGSSEASSSRESVDILTSDTSAQRSFGKLDGVVVLLVALVVIS